jgi:hypothetical protein
VIRTADYSRSEFDSASASVGACAQALHARALSLFQESLALSQELGDKRGAPEQAHCMARRPVRQVAHTHYVLSIVLRQLDRYGEVELVAPAIRPPSNGSASQIARAVALSTSVAMREMPPCYLPPTILATLIPFAPQFSRRVWVHVQVLVAGALLAPARRTVAAALHVLELAQSKPFHRYHRVLSQARWSGLALSRTLLRLLIATFVPDGPLVN